MQGTAWLAALSAVGLLLAAGCDRREGNANAPGSPGTGNPAEVVQPSAPDSAPGGPSGIKGSLPHPGSSGGDAVTGTTGSGAGSTTGTSAPAAGTGTGGGLTGSFPPASSPGTGTAPPSGAQPQGTTSTAPSR